MTIEHDKYSMIPFSKKEMSVVKDIFTFSSYTLMRQIDRTIRKVHGDALLKKIDLGPEI